MKSGISGQPPTTNDNGGHQNGFEGFQYKDTDEYQKEISEFYTYFENNEMRLNYDAYQRFIMNYRKFNSNWSLLPPSKQLTFITFVAEFLEVQESSLRLRAERCLLYLLQGCFMEVESIVEQQKWTRRNVLLFAHADLLPILVGMLKYEIKDSNPTGIRIILTILYVLVEVNRHEMMSSDFKESFNSLTHDIMRPFKGELLLITLFNMMRNFTDGAVPRYPIKKILLLIWKIILVGMGGMERLSVIKNSKRAKTGLPPVSSGIPPIVNPPDKPLTEDNVPNTNPELGILRRTSTNLNISKNRKNNMSLHQNSYFVRSSLRHLRKRKPKYYLDDLEHYLNYNRMKYFGYTLSNDNETLIGLPDIVQRMVHVIKDNLYVPLSEIQKKTLTRSEEDEADTTEILYEKMLPNQRQYVISLLKLFLYGIPNYIPRTSVFDILPEVFLNNIESVDYADYKVDIERHKEILLKAITAIIILLLKHFKRNHIYQFEFLAQNLMCANGLNVMVQFLECNLSLYSLTCNFFPHYEFPQFHLYDTAEESYVPHQLCWRNVFTIVNVLRILNMLIKWRNYRIRMMVELRATTSIKRLLNVNVPPVEYYALKLLKMQVKYCDKRWRRMNMMVISRIYKHIRHYMHDDWLMEYDSRIVSATFVGDEDILLATLYQFHAARYPKRTGDEGWQH